MKIDAEMVQRWLDAYNHAWSSYDPDEIGALFTKDAEYRWHPWDEGDNVARGRSQIVAAWLKDRDAVGTYRGVYRPLLVKDDMAIAMGLSYYYTDKSQGPRDAQRANRNAPIGSAGCFTPMASRFPASWAWFQDRSEQIAQRKSRAISVAWAARCAIRGRHTMLYPRIQAVAETSHAMAMA